MTTQADLDLGTHKVVTDERVKEQNRLQRLLIRPEMGALIGAIAIFIFFFAIAPAFRRRSTRFRTRIFRYRWASWSITPAQCGTST